MQNISDLQQKLNEAEAHVNELRKQIDAQRKTERMEAVASIKELIKSHDLTAADLGFSGKAASAAKRTNTGDKRNSVAPKYQDPDSGKTWTGRGKTPAWLSTLLASGRDKQEFSIQS